MPTKITTKTIIAIVLAILGFGAIIVVTALLFRQKCISGMIWNEEQKKCVPVCKDGEKYYASLDKCSKCAPGLELHDGKCLAVCEADEVACGDRCMSPPRLPVHKRPALPSRRE